MAEPIVTTFRASDGYEFYARYWRAGNVSDRSNGTLVTYVPGSPLDRSRPRARIVWVHGIRSHGGWYPRSCGELAAAGYEVHFLDRRGSGMNSAHRGDCPSFRRLLDDVAEYILALRREQAWLPLFLGGISWGGKLAAALPYRKPWLVDGLILACPGHVPKIAPPFLRRMRIAAARLLRPSRRFPIPLNEPELFTADPKWQAFIDQDRFGLREATARFLFASFGLDLYLRRAAKRVTIPTLLLLAEHDRIIDNQGTRQFVTKFPTNDVTVIEYPGAHHTLEFEGANHPFVGDTLKWLDGQLGSAPES